MTIIMIVNNRFGFNQFGNKKYRESIYKGCYNFCRYCNIMKTQCRRLNRRNEELWFLMSLNKKNYNKKINKRDERSILFTAHDIFWFNKAICFKFIKNMLDRNNSILFFSKPRWNIIKKFCEKFSLYKNLIQFRFTITTENNDLIKFWEINSSPFEERFKCLKFVYENGWKTSVIIEPFLDSPEELIKLVNKIDPYINGTIWIGHMNNITSFKNLKKNKATDREIREYEKIRNNYKKENLIKIVNNLKDNPKIRYKESFLNKSYLDLLIPNYQKPLLKT